MSQSLATVRTSVLGAVMAPLDKPDPRPAAAPSSPAMAPLAAANTSDPVPELVETFTASNGIRVTIWKTRGFSRDELSRIG